MEGKEKPKPKRRGRKPKKKEVAKVETNKLTDSLIIKLNHFKNDETLIEPYNNEDIFQETENNNISEVCWNCCHGFNNMVHGIPLKYINGMFYVYGDFCSLECCLRYTVDNFNNNYEIISLIKLYSNIIQGQNNKDISIAPNKLLLKKFGGSLTIEEYRDKFNKNIHDIKIPPILPVNHNIDSYEINNTNNKTNLKLCRSKPLPSDKKSITKSMNLLIE